MGPKLKSSRAFTNEVHTVSRKVGAKRARKLSVMPTIIHRSGIVIKVELFPNGSNSSSGRKGIMTRSPNGGPV